MTTFPTEHTDFLASVASLREGRCGGVPVGPTVARLLPAINAARETRA